MINEEGSIVIDDEDDVEIVEVDDEERPQQEVAHKGSVTPTNAPLAIKGYTKPGYSYSQLITQALAVCHNRQATATVICEQIAKKQPYFRYYAGNWRGSISNALDKRKKFFMAVGKTQDQEVLWSFNPTFEKYMLDKWLPKRLKKTVSLTYSPCSVITRAESSPKPPTPDITSSETWRPPSPLFVSIDTIKQQSPEYENEENPVIAPSPVLETSDSLRASSPVIVSTKSLRPDIPEFNLADPYVSNKNEEHFQQIGNPWEPEVNVSVDSLSPQAARGQGTTTKSEEVISSIPPPAKDFSLGNILPTRRNVTEVKGSIAPPAKDFSLGNTLPTRRNFADFIGYIPPPAKDFSLSNILPTRRKVENEEINYRLKFHREHPNISKFRLHCTVCDCHLGTKVLAARNNVRFHIILGVLVCASCYYVKNQPLLNVNICHWCYKNNRVNQFCVKCSAMFCEICLGQNFGQFWFDRLRERKEWACFLCDTNQIWPHRAIAYFLYRHYNDFKKLTAQKTTVADIDHYHSDLSSCCTKDPTQVVQQLKSSLLSTPSLTATSSLKPSTTTSAPPVHTPTEAPVDSTSPRKIVGVFSNSRSPDASQQSSEQLSPNVYLQTPGVPSVTLNTGTQYIHNVYPDKNYVIMQPPAGTTYPQLYHHMRNPSDTPATPRYQNQPTSSCDLPMAFQTALNRPKSYRKHLNTTMRYRPSNSPADTAPVLPMHYVDVSAPYRANEEHSTNTSNIQSVSNTNPFPTTSKFPNPSNNNPLTSTLTENVHTSESTVVPSKASDKSTDLKNPTAIKILRENIESRPMPKSKKQSLLRTVLMNESIESMKRHLQSVNADEPNTSSRNTTVPLLDKPDAVVGQSATTPRTSNDEQNIEEPILKSIIQTATERLLNLKKKNHGNQLLDKGDSEEVVDLCQDEKPVKMEPKNDWTDDQAPRIKIKTLRELQEPKGMEENAQHIVAKKVNPSDKQEQNVGGEATEKDDVMQVDKAPKEINVTGLKQGIIEASRTLVDTQKRFKELAKIISCNLTYQKEDAVDLVKSFQDILKLCKQKIEVIDKSIKKEFNYLIPQNDMDAMLESIRKSSDNSGSQLDSRPVKKRNLQKRMLNYKTKQGRKKKVATYNPDDNSDSEEATEVDTPSRAVKLQWQNDNIVEVEVGNDQSATARKRDLVDFNPLGKKLILGTPEVTHEDLEHIPGAWSSQTHANDQGNNSVMNDVVRRQNSLKNTYKKKRSIWDNRRKTRRPEKIFNKNGMLRKKVGRPPKSVYLNLNDPDETIYSPRNREKQLQKPLRLSERNHPSSAAIAAHLYQSSDYPNGYPRRYVIKPCSVVLHKLNPRIVQLLQQRM